LGYIKYLTDARVKSLSLKLLTIEEQSVAPIRQAEEGLLLGLYDSQRKFLGIGVLRGVDYLRKALKVLTSVSEKPSSITLGKVRLDENLKEIPFPLEETMTRQQAKV
jgi:polynucleotide 5'-kinase involved in rRNA processing